MARSSDVWKSLRISSMDYLTELQDILRKFQMMWLHPCLKPTLQTLFLQKQTMARKWERLCFLQRQITQLQKWMAGVFPSTATHFVHQQPGIQVEAIGDALEVKLCKPILNYRIVTTRRIKSTCNPHFPIKLPYRNDLFFENI